MDTTSSILSNDRNFIWHPFTQMQTAQPPIPIIKGEGAYLYSADGKRYLDAISSWWVNLHGHAHPYIVNEIKAQAEELEHVIFADFTHAPAVNLAARLLPLLPGKMDKIFYSDNGSTAVECALKMAFQYWYNKDPKTNRTKTVCFKNGYHGDTFGAMSTAGRNRFNRPFWKQLFEVEAIDPPIKGYEEESLKQMEAVLAKGDTACFIFEPLVMAAAGMVIYSQEGLENLIECCKKHGVLTIADEVMTGFGRTGPLFACDLLPEPPDIICLSKGITGGFLPLGATACTDEIYNAFLSNRLDHAFLHGHSYAGNPIACRCALASLDLLLQRRCTEQRELIAANHKSFCMEWNSHPRLKRCESLGTLLTLEYRCDSPSYFEPLRDKLYRYFIGREILIRPLGNVLYLLPPYCIDEKDLKHIYDEIAITLETNL